MKLKYLILGLLILPFCLAGQGTKVGVRAGLDFSTIDGPLEAAETSPFSTGFHFGINVSRYYTEQFSIRGELVYQQKGFRKEYQGDGFYGIRTSQGIFFEEGSIDYLLEVSNAYVSLPITFHYQPVKQIEFFAGVSANFLINPIGSGLLSYTSNVNPDRTFYRHTLGFEYYQDVPGSNGGLSVDSPQVYVNDEIVVVPGTVGAYYFLDTSFEDERAFKIFDVSAVVGTQIYVNKSFYISLRGEYGFRDLTNDNVDISLESISPTGGLQFNSDDDHQVNFEASVGFRF